MSDAWKLVNAFRVPDIEDAQDLLKAKQMIDKLLEDRDRLDAVLLKQFEWIKEHTNQIIEVGEKIVILQKEIALYEQRENRRSRV